MLNQIDGVDIVFSHISHDLAYHIVLVVAWEDHSFLGDRFGNAVLDDFLYFPSQRNLSGG